MSKLGVLAIAFLLHLVQPGLLAQQQKAAPPVPAGPRAAAGGSQASSEPVPFIIGPDDVLDISVWNQTNVSRTVPVRLDGKISIPLVNDIQAAGLTPMQLAAIITERLKAFIKNPQVTVTVTAINSQVVFAVGELNHPGPIRLLPNMTALKAISMAGGITQFADEKHAYILRHEGGKDIRYPLNYRKLMRGDMRENIALKSGDTIVFP
jgi:polysaccharide export outer membrane protein